MSFDPIVYDAVNQVIGKFSKFDPRIRISYPIFNTKDWIAPADGLAIVRVMGAGGSGARGNGTASYLGGGGYSGAWGCKIVRVTKGQVLSFIIGAGGANQTMAATAGNNGGNSSVTINGVMYVAAGGAGGLTGTNSDVPNAPALPSTWDFGAASVKPGWYYGVTGGSATGGAGVDILMQGNNATTSASINFSGGGGTGSPSDGTTGGGAGPSGVNALGQPDAGSVFDASRGEWGISFFGGAGGNSSGGNANGGNGGGGGGAPSGNGGNGGNGGGGGGNSGGGAGSSYGGGGGGNSGGAPSGNGGNGYAHIEFFPDTPV